MFKITSKTVSAVASTTPTDFTRTPLPLYIEPKIINAIPEAIYLVTKKLITLVPKKETSAKKYRSKPSFNHNHKEKESYLEKIMQTQIAWNYNFYSIHRPEI